MTDTTTETLLLTPTALRSVEERLTAPPLSGRPYLTHETVFESMVRKQREEAHRAIDDLDGEIHQLQTEIEARLIRRSDLAAVVARANAALDMATPQTRTTPQLTATDTETGTLP